MDYCISEVFPSSAINDAVLVPSFYDDRDALALAKGNHLVIYTVEDEFVVEPKSFEIYGVIEKLIPLKSNLLVILTDLRACILKADDNDPNNLITVRNGTFQNAWESSRVPIKYAIHPTCLILQLENFQLDLYPITSDCPFGDPFKIKIGRKGIIGFQFIGPVSKVTRLAVLTEEYNNKPPVIHLFEIDPINRSYSEDPSFDVKLNDAYFMIPYDVEEHSIAIVFSTQQATRVMYNELNPYAKTATIYTLDRLIKMIALTPEFHLAIDQANKLHAVNIKEAGQVRFVNIGNVPHPSEFVKITSNLAFVASNKDDSVLLAINQENNTYNASVFDTIRSTGKIINFREFGNSIISIYERAVIESKLMCDFSPFLQIECPGFIHIFSFYFDGKGVNCFAFSDEVSTSVMGENIDREFIDLSDMFDSTSPTFLFYALGKNSFLQVTANKIWLYKYINDPEEKFDSICIDLPIGESEVTQVSRYENAFAVLTNDNKIYFYDIISESNNIEKIENKEKENNDLEEEIVKENKNGGEEAEKNEIENTEKVADDENKSYEIRQRNQIIVENNQISSISLSNNFLAISCFNPDKISIYHFQNGDFVFARSIEIGPIVDLAFHNGTFYALSPTEKITLVQPNFSTLTVLSCPGRHSSIRPINDKTIIVCGPDPSVIFGYNKVYPLNLKSQITDAIFSEDSLAVLTNDSLLFGNLSDPFYYNQSFTSPSKLLDIIEYDDMYIFIQYNSSNIVTFYSIPSKGKGNIDLEKYLNDSQKVVFGGLQQSENYVDHIKQNDSLIISSSSRILTYQFVSKKPVLVSVKKYPRQIYKIGTFRNYYYIQFCEEIQFFYPSYFFSENSEDSLKPVFSITNNARIMSCVTSNQMIAFTFSKKQIALFDFDDYNERLIQFSAPFQSRETITALSIIDETVIFATSHGNIFSLDLIPDMSGSSLSSRFEIVVKEGFCTDEKIVKMCPMRNNSFVMAASVNGMSLKIEKFKDKHPKFYELYRVLSANLRSIGKFTKEYQRCPKDKSYLLSMIQMCDRDLLSSFAALKTNEKKAILEGSSISLELANEILQFIGL